MMPMPMLRAEEQHISHDGARKLLARRVYDAPCRRDASCAVRVERVFYDDDAGAQAQHTCASARMPYDVHTDAYAQ